MHLGKIPAKSRYDAIIVGSGPNGLAASITIAQAGRSVLLIEQKETVGGGTRTADLTLPSFLHDICSAVHPMGAASPFFRMLDLSKYGLDWVYPPASVAHPLDDGTAVLLERSVETTAENLGVDAAAYQKLMCPLIRDWEKLANDLLGPLRLPHHPLALLRFGPRAIRSLRNLAERSFRGERARALFAGLGAHSILPLEHTSSAPIALVLGILGHAVGWPVAKGGSQRIANALADCLLSQGGEIVTGARIESLGELPQARAMLMDLTPHELLRVAGNRLPSRYRQELEEHLYGPAVFKMDWALDSPISWKAAECARAATVHVGGTLEEIAASERAVWEGKQPERPFVMLAQQSLFDPTRAPTGKHTAWGYCHVPHKSKFDMTERIESQIERFAPGFRKQILARKAMSPAEIEDYNPNYFGGDIAGGVQSFWKIFAHPAIRRKEYSTPVRGLYVCSSSTPPGAGVHGMCGYHAARRALSEVLSA